MGRFWSLPPRMEAYCESCQTEESLASLRFLRDTKLVSDPSMKPVLNSLGMRHLAIRVRNLDRALWFYRDLLGFGVVWQPDEDNVYLSSGCDNLALHRVDTLNTVEASRGGGGRSLRHT